MSRELQEVQADVWWMLESMAGLLGSMADALHI
jgi:hypothetical protein